jgi:hypothetical protein
MTPFSLYNPQTLEITVIVFSDVQPENSTSKMANGQVKPMYDIDNDLIYEGATEEEIAAAQTPSLTVNDVIIDLVTRQVEVMSDAEKSELLTLLNG